MSTLPTPHIAGLPDMVPFVAPEELEVQLGIRFRARLGANESVFGASPMAIEAMAKAGRDPQWYGDPQANRLREALAEHHSATPDQFVVGPGIDGLMLHLTRAYLDPMRTAISTLGTYPTWEYAVNASGATILRIPYNQDRVDLEAMQTAATGPNVRVVYLANPDNPSGSLANSGAVQTLRESLRDDQLLILDEAYADFVSKEDLFHPDGDDPNVVRLRTFSKAHGLAGLRVAYAMGSPTVLAPLHKVRGHFEVGSVAQAGSVASLADRAHLDNTIETIKNQREKLARLLKEFGLEPLSSYTNFVTASVGTRDDAIRLLENLLLKGIFIRKPNHPPLDRCIRVSVGTDDDLCALREALVSIQKG